MASTVNFNNHVKQFNDSMRGMARILYVGKNYDLSANRVLASKPWRRIYTTSMDQELYQFFSREDRQVNVIHDFLSFRSSKTELDQRNPLLIFLNSVSGDSEDVKQKLYQKENRQKLCSTLRQIMRADLVSLVIIGYDPSAPGELSTEELAAILRDINERSVVFYGLSEHIEQDPYIQMLISDGIATVFSQDLGDALETMTRKNEQLLEENDDFCLSDSLDLHSTVFISGRPCQIEQSLYYDFAKYGQVLSVRTMDTGTISPMLQVDYFYRFLKRSPYEPQWYGYNRKNAFAVRRDFENTLYSNVTAKLASGTSDPIILVGQTSSGKSVALASLAYRIFQEHKYPVLFVTNPEATFAVDSPSFQALDNLLLEMEKQEAERVLVIIDCSIYNLKRNDSIRRTMDRYINRGRKIVIVASAIQKTTEGYDFVEAPIQITEQEKKDFCNLVVEKGKLLRVQVERWMQKNIQDANLLSVLYRLLWDIHPQLERGLNAEISRGLEDTKKDILDLPVLTRAKKSLSSLADQLVNLGLIEDPNADAVGAENKQEEVISRLQPFCKSLAVASLFKLRMPITMAMRLLNISERYSNRQKYLDVVFNSPWLRYAMDNDEYAQGEYYVTFRTPADARIYLASLNIEDVDKMQIVADTARSLKDNPGPFFSDEVRFIERLIRMIGPNSEDDSTRDNWYHSYGPGCSLVIDSLAELRDADIIEPQLVAQEITYIREYYGNDSNSVDVRIKNLESAVIIAREMLDLVSRPVDDQIFWKPGLIDSILVESMFAELKLEKAYRESYDQGSSISHNPAVSVFRLYSYAERQHKLMEVIQSQPENSYAYTALLSCFLSYYNDSSVNREDKLKQFASVLEVVDKVSVSIPGVAVNESYQRKNYEFQHIFSSISNTPSNEEYFQKLLDSGSAVGVYMKARTRLSKAGIQWGKQLNENEIAVCCDTLSLIENPQYAKVVMSDAASQYIRLQLKWLCSNRGDPIFSHERQYTHIAESDWNDLYTICADFKSNIIDRQLNSPYISTIYYVLALAAAQLGNYEAAVDTWRSIHENDFHSVGRQKTWHLLCMPDGNPIFFTGTFNSQFPLSERQIYIKELQRPVLYPSLQSINKSEPKGEVKDLCIGISYRGFSAFTKNWAKRRT